MERKHVQFLFELIELILSRIKKHTWRYYLSHYTFQSGCAWESCLVWSNCISAHGIGFRRPVSWPHKKNVTRISRVHNGDRGTIVFDPTLVGRSEQFGAAWQNLSSFGRVLLSTKVKCLTKSSKVWLHNFFGQSIERETIQSHNRPTNKSTDQYVCLSTSHSVSRRLLLITSQPLSMQASNPPTHLPPNHPTIEPPTTHQPPYLTNQLVNQPSSQVLSK